MPEKVARLALLIIQRPRCVECLAANSDVPLDEIEPLITRIGATIALNCTQDRCGACGRTGRIYSARMG